MGAMSQNIVKSSMQLSKAQAALLDCLTAETADFNLKINYRGGKATQWLPLFVIDYARAQSCHIQFGCFHEWRRSDNQY
jgi:hypothetical protein